MSLERDVCMSGMSTCMHGMYVSLSRGIQDPLYYFQQGKVSVRVKPIERER